MIGTLLSEKLRSIRDDRQPVTFDDLSDMIHHAELMEQNVYEAPKRRNADPDTSHWDGDTSKLKKNQIAVLRVYVLAGIPLDATTLQQRYFQARDVNSGDFPQQAPSGIRARHSELVRLGAIVRADKEGRSPTGRKVYRYEQENR